MKGLIEPLLDLDLGVGQVESSRRRFELIADAIHTDRVIVGDGAGQLCTEDGSQIAQRFGGSPSGGGVSGAFAEARDVLGDEHLVEVLGGAVAGVNMVALEFCGEAALEGAVEAFAATAGLRAVGEDQVYGEGLHRLLEVCGRRGYTLFLGPMVGGDELAGAVEVEGSRQAESAEDVVADLEAAVAVFLRLELADQRDTGGVIAGQQQAYGRIGVSEPGMRGAVEKEQLAFACGSTASAAMGVLSVEGFAKSEGAEPSAESLIGQPDMVLVGEGIGQVGEVIVGVGGGSQRDDFLAESGRFGKCWGSASIGVEGSVWAGGSDLDFEPLDLADG